MILPKRTPRALPACLLALAALFPVSLTARAAPNVSDCSTPRRAVETWLDNAHDHPRVAATCFDFSGTEFGTDAERTLAVRHLLAVFDQRGYYVYPDTLPDTAEVEGTTQVPPVRRFAEAFVEKDGHGWRFPPSVVRQIPGWYVDTFDVDVESLVAQLPEWAKTELLTGVAVWQLLLLALAILLGLVTRALVAFVVGNYGGKLIKRAGEAADAKIVTRAAHPVGTLAMVGVLWYALPLLRLSVRLNQIGTIALRVMMAGAGVLLLYRLVDLASDVFSRRAEQTDTKLDDQLVPLVRKASKVFVVCVGVIFVLQNMDVDVGSLLAGASLGGLAFTLAARDTVANLFGSISIFADHPFQVGDWVIIDGHEGVVEEVGMRSTRIRTFYSSLITIPNSVVANAAVDNYGMREFRRCMVTLGVTYDTTPAQMRAFVEGIRAILQANPKVRKDAYEVSFRNFGASGLEVLLYFFFKTDTWSDELAQRENIFLEVLRLAQQLDVQFAFPTQTLHIESHATREARSPKVELDEAALAEIVRSFGPGGSASRPIPQHLTTGYLPGQDPRGTTEVDD